MRMLWLVGLVLLTSTATANAQPGPDSEAPPSAAPLMTEPPALAPTPALLAPPASAPLAPAMAPPPAFAAPGMVPPASTTFYVEPPLESYRWQVVSADVVGLVIALAHQESSLQLAGLTYLLGAPLVHSLHGEVGRAGTSLALRVGLPLAGALAGLALTQRSSRRCTDDDFDCGGDEVQLVAAGLGIGLGVAAAMFIDTAVISRPKRNYAATWAPQLAVTPQHVSLGVLGRF